MSIFSKKAIRPLVVFGSSIMVLMAISFMARGLYGSSDVYEIGWSLASMFASYIFGSLYAFSDWFSFWTGSPSALAYIDPGNTYGFYTFAAAFKFFGSTRILPSGVFEEPFAHGDFLVTNIYTMFRSLITDFGLLGCIAYCGITSFGLHLSFYAMLSRAKPVVTASIFILMVGYFWHSYVGSLFAYNIAYPYFAFLWLILFANNYRNLRAMVE